jgi:hypothetical protein
MFGAMFGGLNPLFAAQLKALFAAAGGGKIVSGFRTYAEQAALYAQKGPGLAAPPGHSKHEVGLAADISGNLPLLHKLAPLFGLGFPMSWEPWHIQPLGTFKSGLWNVPEDNFPALLHKGEMVLPAEAAKFLRSSSYATNYNITVQAGAVTISASNLKDFNNAVDFFKQLPTALKTFGVTA